MCGILHLAVRGNRTSDYYVEVHDNFSRARDKQGKCVGEKKKKKDSKKKAKGVKIIIIKGYRIRFAVKTTEPFV